MTLLSLTKKNLDLKETLKSRNHNDFVLYYEQYVQKKIRDHVISNGDKLWTNNNTESMNHRLKVLIGWEPRKIDELVEKLHALVKLQLVDFRRAIYGTGNFILNGRYAKYKITKHSWISKKEEDKEKLLKKVLSAVNKEEKAVTSKDGRYTVFKKPNLAKKPNQRKRCRANRSQPKY